MQHIDGPDNSPDLPWEFNDANKEKVSSAHNFKLLNSSGCISIRMAQIRFSIHQSFFLTRYTV